jgi:hypothetical protein
LTLAQTLFAFSRAEQRKTRQQATDFIGPADAQPKGLNKLRSEVISDPSELLNRFGTRAIVTAVIIDHRTHCRFSMVKRFKKTCSLVWRPAAEALGASYKLSLSAATGIVFTEALPVIDDNATEEIPSVKWQSEDALYQLQALWPCRVWTPQRCISVAIRKTAWKIDRFYAG